MGLAGRLSSKRSQLNHKNDDPVPSPISTDSSDQSTVYEPHSRHIHHSYKRFVMGLKQVKFIDWFQEQFPRAARTVPSYEGSNFDSVFIDVNCILHPSIRTAKNEAMFVKKLFTILDRLLAQFIPDRICYLSVDGPAPLAKLLTQKARRAAKGSQKRSNCMSTLQVTPGCPFMSRLEQYLSYYTVRYLQQRRSQGISPDLKFVIDHSNNPGEGESKIIENIVQQASNIRGRPCAIISMDSDAVLQAIALGMPNIYVIRKDSPFDPAVIVSIDRFMRSLEEIFPGESNRSRLDFCALCLFRGNDYLRGLFVGLERLWRAYLYTRLVDPLIQARGPLRFLIDAEFKTFDLFFLKQLILHSFKSNDGLRLPENIEQHRTRQHEQHQMQKQEHKQKRQPKDRSRGSLAFADVEQQYENESDMESVDDENEATEHVTDSDSETDGAEEAAVEDAESEEDDSNPYSIKQFLQGVLWNLEMYCSGKCPDVSFTYEHRTAPPRRAIVTYVDATAQTKLNHRLLPSTTNKLVGVIASDKKFLHPLVCALILLPAETGAAYLPQSIAPIHTEIVPGDSKHLTQDEMEDIDAKVQGLIDILGASHQPHDNRIAQELSALYTTRAPYIWTRARFVNSRSRPEVMPLSPTAIIERLAELPAAAATGSTPGPRTGGFLELPYQPDILCHMVKTSPTMVHDNGSSPSQPSKGGLTHTHAVPWAVDDRQLCITGSMRTPSARWPFYNVKGNRFRNPRSAAAQSNPPQRTPVQSQPSPQQQPPQQWSEQQQQQQQQPLQTGGGKKQTNSRHGKGRRSDEGRGGSAKAASAADSRKATTDQKAVGKNVSAPSSSSRQSGKRVPKSNGDISGLLAAVDIAENTVSMVAAE
ncbi:hypothetical protein BGZ72_010294 [Mortierella alpina]|nr:hypothetical protein BGZ72_010294 [Mortierella alpina]